MTKASDNAFPSILITEGTEPSAPAAGKQRVYIDSTTHHLMRTNSSGTETDIEAGASGIPATILDAKGDLIAASAADTAAKVTVGTNDMALLAASGASAGVAWDWPPGHEFVYTQITSAVNVTNTTETTGDLVITASAATFDGDPVVLTFYSPAVSSDLTAGRDIRITLFESTSMLTRLGLCQAAATTGNADNRAMMCTYRFTPSNASHTYLIRASVSAGTGVIQAGAGGSATYSPAFVRIVKA